MRVPRFPILLLHGLNAHDSGMLACWGRLPALMRQAGAVVCFGGQDGWGAIESGAAQAHAQAMRLLEQERCERINLIAHSKGGLEARYLISSLGFGARAASLTTIATPHRGSETAGRLGRSDRLLACAALFVNAYARLTGDRDPDFAAAIGGLRPVQMARFNAANPDHPDVFYQSWGVSLGGARDDLRMALTSRLIRRFDGENDGLVSPASARWGVDRGVLTGISHQDVIDRRRRDLPALDHAVFYLTLLDDLARRGF